MNSTRREHIYMHSISWLVRFTTHPHPLTYISYTYRLPHLLENFFVHSAIYLLPPPLLFLLPIFSFFFFCFSFISLLSALSFLLTQINVVLLERRKRKLHSNSKYSTLLALFFIQKNSSLLVLRLIESFSSHFNWGIPPLSLLPIAGRKIAMCVYLGNEPAIGMWRWRRLLLCGRTKGSREINTCKFFTLHIFTDKYTDSRHTLSFSNVIFFLLVPRQHYHTWTTLLLGRQIHHACFLQIICPGSI